MECWEFWIDVGGTFTDCIARSPDGEMVPFKTLSSGVTKGQIDRLEGHDRFFDAQRRGEPDGFWIGYELRLLDDTGETVETARVTAFDSATGLLTVDKSLPISSAGIRYEVSAGEESPILCVRRMLGLGLSDTIPPISMRLGTTRGTNALLERKGARTGFVTTRGFRDVLLIANQDRPRLFDLAIHKPQPMFVETVEIDERLDAAGKVLRTPNADSIRKQLLELQKTDVESIAICLLHSFANPAHEELVETIAREVGFEEISMSSRLSPLIKIVSRGDTTVVDAYLNPVLRAYVGRLRRALGGDECETASPPLSTLKIMTSAGGLVDADRFVGKDSILSGPAGGVVGFSRVAEAAGFAKSIGFDMGGTSTDVSRFDGKYELEFETQKASVRVVAPMLAIHTVAAGGGSICQFDGVKLAVGPESSGADPGPACYGRGGPLSVTDINLYLGRIVSSRFPFPLDRDAVEQKLEVLCDEIADSPLGHRYTPIELADGFLQIANANMTRAIRRISVAKGYDPADYALVTFGGAGAQHACAIAEAIGIKTVLVHPFAGILSAYGIGLADVRRFGQQSVLKPYSAETLQEIEPLFEELETTALAEVKMEGIADENIGQPLRSLDMRYQGVETTINVSYGAAVDPAAQYQQMHQRLYGYVHENRAIEITAARVEVVGRTAAPPVETMKAQHHVPEPTETVSTWFGGTEYNTGVFLRENLRAGDEITGPAIVCEPTSTIVIDPGWRADVTERGEVVIDCEQSLPVASGRTATDTAPPVAAGGLSTGPDPVLLEIFNNLFASIAEQMGITLQQTSISTNVKERLDFSCAIFDPDGELVVNAPHIPVHLGAMSETVKRVIADNSQIKPGDVFVTNDPYRGGSHLPDVTIVTPVFDCESRIADCGLDSSADAANPKSDLLFFTASRAHHAEIGGIVPGSMPPFSRNLAEEGVLIRNFKLVDEGRMREAELRELLLSGPYPTRSVQDNLSDVAAQVAANNKGVQLLDELVTRYSLSTVQAYMRHIRRAAAEKMRMALSAIPDGEYALTEHLDNDAEIVVTIKINGEQATVDFTGTSPPLVVSRESREQEAPSSLESYNLNANRAIVTAAVLYVFRCLIAEDIPLNGGVLEPVEIVLPECLLNPPEDDDLSQCAAVVGGNVETSQRVVDALLGALKVAAASQGTMNNLTFGDETFGYYETICGGSGATPDEAGADAVHTHMTNTRLTDAEVIERRYPVRVHEFSIRRGSGGAGENRGGDGIVRRLEFLAPLKVSMLSERREAYAPFGLSGGEDGTRGRNQLQRAGSDETIDLGGKFAIDVQPGDILTIETPGGGGYGKSVNDEL